MCDLSATIVVITDKFVIFEARSRHGFIVVVFRKSNPKPKSKSLKPKLNNIRHLTA